MSKNVLIACTLVFAVSILGFGCKEELVGAPCVPETDKGDFNYDLNGTQWSIETRSVQCESRGANMVCLTKTAENANAPNEQAQICADEKDIDACWNDEQVQYKFSFCSCRCRDKDGHKYDENSDKYDDLCECPPNTTCEDVLGDIEGAPEKIKGSYCVPNCIAEPCGDGDICTPSSDSEKPWQWSCEEFELDDAADDE